MSDAFALALPELSSCPPCTNNTICEQHLRSLSGFCPEPIAAKLRLPNAGLPLTRKLEMSFSLAAKEFIRDSPCGVSLAQGTQNAVTHAKLSIVTAQADFLQASSKVNPIACNSSQTHSIMCSSGKVLPSLMPTKSWTTWEKVGRHMEALLSCTKTWSREESTSYYSFIFLPLVHKTTSALMPGQWLSRPAIVAGTSCRWTSCLRASFAMRGLQLFSRHRNRRNNQQLEQLQSPTTKKQGTTTTFNNHQS